MKEVHTVRQTDIYFFIQLYLSSLVCFHNPVYVKTITFGLVVSKSQSCDGLPDISLTVWVFSNDCYDLEIGLLVLGHLVCWVSQKWEIPWCLQLKNKSLLIIWYIFCWYNYLGSDFSSQKIWSHMSLELFAISI